MPVLAPSSAAASARASAAGPDAAQRPAAHSCCLPRASPSVCPSVWGVKPVRELVSQSHVAALVSARLVAGRLRSPAPPGTGTGAVLGTGSARRARSCGPVPGAGSALQLGPAAATPFHQGSAHPCSGGGDRVPLLPRPHHRAGGQLAPPGTPLILMWGECDPHVLGRGRWRRPTSVTAASHPAPCRETRPDPSWDHQPAPRVALRSVGYPRRPDPLKPGTGGVSQLPDHRRGTQPAALPPRVLAAAWVRRARSASPRFCCPCGCGQRRDRRGRSGAAAPSTAMGCPGTAGPPRASRPRAAGGAARGSTAGGGGVLGSPPPPPALALGGLGLWGAHPARSRAPRVCPCLCPRLAPALAPKPSVPAQEPPCRSGGAAPALSPARASGKPLRAAPQRPFGGSLQPPGAPWDPSVPVC